MYIHTQYLIYIYIQSKQHKTLSMYIYIQSKQHTTLSMCTTNDKYISYSIVYTVLYINTVVNITYCNALYSRIRTYYIICRVRLHTLCQRELQQHFKKVF